MGGTPSNYNEMHLGFQAWMLSDGTCESDTPVTTYTEGAGGVQAIIETLQDLATTPYQDVSAYNPNAAGEPFSEKLPTLGSVLQDMKDYLDDFESELDWAERYQAVDNEVNVDASDIDPTLPTVHTVVDATAYTPPVAGTYPGPAAPIYPGPAANVLTAPVAGTYGGPTAGSYVPPVLDTYTPPDLSPTIAAVVESEFELDDDLSEYEDLDIDFDAAVAAFRAKRESEVLQSIAEYNGLLADKGSVNSRNRGVGLAMIQRDIERQVADYRANLELQLRLQHETFRMQFATMKVQFEGLRLEGYKYLLGIEELKLKREGVIQSYKALQLQGEEIILRWQDLTFKNEQFKAEWEKLKYAPEEFIVKYDALKYESGKLQSQFEALKFEPERYKIQYAALVLDREKVIAQYEAFKYEVEKLKLQYQQIVGEREALKLQQSSLEIQNEDMHMKYVTARIGAEIDLAKAMMMVASSLIEAESNHFTRRQGFLATLQGSTELYLNSQKQLVEDTLKLNVEDALWDIKLYEFAGQALGSISGAAVIPHTPNATMEAISGAAGILSPFLSLIPMLL